jgi:hypothetical protein
MSGTRSLTSCSFLSLLREANLFEIHNDQMLSLRSLINNQPAIANQPIIVGERHCLVIASFENDPFWFWSTLDKVMLIINRLGMYSCGKAVNNLFPMFIRSCLRSEIYKDKIYSEFCNRTLLIKSCRNKIKTDCHELIKNLFSTLSIYHPFASGSCDIDNLFDTIGMPDEVLVARNICAKILLLIIQHNGESGDANLAKVLVGLRHLSVISGKLTFNIGILLCTVFRAVIFLSNNDLTYARWLRYIWSEFIQYPFLANIGGEISLVEDVELLSSSEQKNCLILFSALTTFVPLSVYKDYKDESTIHSTLDLNLFFASQESDLKSLCILQLAAFEITNTDSLNKNLYLCVLGGYTSILTNWFNGRCDMVSVGNEKVNVCVAVLPVDFIKSSVLIVNCGFMHVSLGAYTPCILLSCFVLRMLVYWKTKFTTCLKCCYRRNNDVYQLITRRMKEVKVGFDEVIVLMSTKIVPYWHSLLRRHRDKSKQELYRTVSDANLTFESLSNQSVL